MRNTAVITMGVHSSDTQRVHVAPRGSHFDDLRAKLYAAKYEILE